MPPFPPLLPPFVPPPPLPPAPPFPPPLLPPGARPPSTPPLLPALVPPPVLPPFVPPLVPPVLMPPLPLPPDPLLLLPQAVSEPRTKAPASPAAISFRRTIFSFSTAASDKQPTNAWAVKQIPCQSRDATALRLTGPRALVDAHVIAQS